MSSKVLIAGTTEISGHETYRFGMTPQSATDPRWSLLQLVFASVAFFAGLLPLAMTFLTPPVFDLRLIDSSLPALTAIAVVPGVAALWINAWIGKTTGGRKWMGIVSTIFAVLAIASGAEVFFLTGL